LGSTFDILPGQFGWSDSKHTQEQGHLLTLTRVLQTILAHLFNLAGWLANQMPVSPPLEHFKPFNPAEIASMVTSSMTCTLCNAQEYILTAKLVLQHERKVACKQTKRGQGKTERGHNLRLYLKTSGAR